MFRVGIDNTYSFHLIFFQFYYHLKFILLFNLNQGLLLFNCQKFFLINLNGLIYNFSKVDLRLVWTIIKQSLLELKSIIKEYPQPSLHYMSFTLYSLLILFTISLESSTSGRKNTEHSCRIAKEIVRSKSIVMISPHLNSIINYHKEFYIIIRSDNHYRRARIATFLWKSLIIFNSLVHGCNNISILRSNCVLFL